MFSLRFGETLHFWSKHLWPLFFVTAPFALINLLIQWKFGSPYSIVNEQVQLQPVSLSLLLLLWPLGTATLVAQLAAIHSGQPRSLGLCFIVALRVGAPLLLAGLIMAMATGVGLMLLILPGLWIYARLSMLPFVIVLENPAPITALKTSFNMSREHQWPLLFGLVFVTLLVFSITSIIMAALHASGLPGTAPQLLGALLYGLLNALTAIYVFRFYLLARS